MKTSDTSPSRVRRVFSAKKPAFDHEAQHLLEECRDYLGIHGITHIRVLHRYDVEGIDANAWQQSIHTIFSEPPVDDVFEGTFPAENGDIVFAYEYLPGQYDMRSDAAAQAVQILTTGEKPLVRSATVVVLAGKLSTHDVARIKSFLINPVDSREASLEIPATLETKYPVPDDVKIMTGFIGMERAALTKLIDDIGFAMDIDDLIFCQAYFRDDEKRDPSFTELKIIDTYWSDHCRHTTFLTEIDTATFDAASDAVEKAFKRYETIREELYRGRTPKDRCLMDIATIGAKKLKKDGHIPDLDESDEINACSIVVDAEVNGTREPWLVQFKNETHNHPTEIEPFGGAATCIGGAIRDPLSGRAFVYQAMRVTGAGDPRKSAAETMPGKLPQRKITTGAAHGYSSYGNQIGLSTGLVHEIYDEGYAAKRMEIGAVIGASPKSYVRRDKPVPGDVIVLLGGRTGRDGCGGATGSSKAHTAASIETCGAEVQKGNAPEERKIQRLFRNPDVTRLIKKCNDFGAGGVSVAIGELADGLSIDLDSVPKKYEGLNGTELAISESQERMAVVLSPSDVDRFIACASGENLEATVVAEVTKEPVMTMRWRGKTIVSLKRNFLNSNGAKKHAAVHVAAPSGDPLAAAKNDARSVAERLSAVLTSLNAASQKGLTERFDSNIGAASVVMPYGGAYQETPLEYMAAKLPVLTGETTTATVMSFGFDPRIARVSPFHGAVFAVVVSLSRIVSSGADWSKSRLTFQEYFERLRKDPSRWGKPFAALLGALTVQIEMKIPAIGGKDSMSGSFENIDVPPTLVSFAVSHMDVRSIVTPEFKKPGHAVYFLPIKLDAASLPDWEYLRTLYTRIHEGAEKGAFASCRTTGVDGAAESISKMCFGNRIGFKAEASVTRDLLFAPAPGGFIIEMNGTDDIFRGLNAVKIGETVQEYAFSASGETVPLRELHAKWRSVFESVFPMNAKPEGAMKDFMYTKRGKEKSTHSTAKPRVLIASFPGTNSEYDSARAFDRAGAESDILVFRNRTPKDVEGSIDAMVKRIAQSQILMIPGGFSSGDEPEGSGKFIAAVFRNPRIADAVMELLTKRDGLILGICNGFQALVKIGLVPYGEIRTMTEHSPTLSFNTIARHVATMARTKVVSSLSPWFSTMKVGDMHMVPISHGEGRFLAEQAVIDSLIANGQIATRYVHEDGRAASERPDNPNGSMCAIEGITSPDGRVLGKMGHSERVSDHVAVNVPGTKLQPIFEAGVRYFW